MQWKQFDGRSDDKGLEVRWSEWAWVWGLLWRALRTVSMLCIRCLMCLWPCAQVESMTIATVCSKTFLFVGAERTSTIFVFDITVVLAPFFCILVLYSEMPGLLP